MQHRSSIRLPMYAAALGAAVSILAFAGCSSPDPAADQGAAAAFGYRGVMLPEPVQKPATVLTTTEGEPYDIRSRTEGSLTLLFFGYANCPDICPVHMASIASVLARMPYEEASQVKVVFVTVDPARDTPQKLRAWLDQFDHRFIALTGDSASLRAAQQELGITPAVKDSVDGSTGYAMAHAAQVYAFTSDGLAHLVYPFGTRQTDWAQDLPRLLEEQWGTPSAGTSVAGGSR